MPNLAAVDGSAMELVNETPQTEVGNYDTAYMADFYDTYWATSGDNDADVPVFWDLIQKQLKDTGLDRLTVLDLGTGTGRIIKGLAGLVPASAEENLSRVDVIGLDISKAMLDKAREFDSPKFGSLTWILGDILDLPSVLPKDSKIDLMILGLGNIGHLHESGQFEKLLAEARNILKPGTGRMYVTLHDTSSNEDMSQHMQEEETETPLLSDPNMFVRQNMIVKNIPRNPDDTKDKVSVESRTLFIHRDTANRRDVVVANYSVKFQLLLWDVDSIKDAVSKAGWTTVDEFHNEQQAYLGLTF